MLLAFVSFVGGPGMPSSGYGNFLEIGPHNSSFYKREGSFVDNFNVLFVDNPVGVGYSYVSDSATKLVTNGAEIGEDLYSFFKVFITERHPEFKNVPIYVFGESYGGKMATEFVYALTQVGTVIGLKIFFVKVAERNVAKIFCFI
jgi:serine carboxypeptidase 1